MSIAQILANLAHDKQTQTILALIIVDLVLGILAAVKLGTFKLVYVADFARNDLLGKALPFFAIHAAAAVAGGTNIVIPGLDLANIATGIFALITAAMVASVLSSLGDLGFPTLPASLAARDPNSAE